MGEHRCDPYTEATDSDSDSPDDDQASADAGAATVNATDANETDNCEVCLVAQREPRLALVPCGHRRFCEACIRHRNVLEVLSYLPCGDQHGSTSVLTFSVNFYQLAELSCT